MSNTKTISELEKLSTAFQQHMKIDKQKNYQMYTMLQNNYIDKLQEMEHNNTVLQRYKKMVKDHNTSTKKIKLDITTEGRKLKYSNELAQTHYNFTVLLKFSLAAILMGILAMFVYKAYLRAKGYL